MVSSLPWEKRNFAEEEAGETWSQVGDGEARLSRRDTTVEKYSESSPGMLIEPRWRIPPQTRLSATRSRDF